MSKLYKPKDNTDNKALDLDEMRKIAKFEDSDIELAGEKWRSNLSGKGKTDYANLLDDNELEEE